MSARFALELSVQRVSADGLDGVDRAQLRRWVLAALSQPATLSLRFVDADESAELNGRFRHRSGPTNVLTFDYEEPDRACADIVICVPVVRAEAAAARIAFRDHLAHMVIHGVLHAQGHDHVDDDEARAMEALETQLLARFRIADPYHGAGPAPAAR